MPDWVAVTLYFNDSETAEKVYNENQKDGHFSFEAIIPYPTSPEGLDPKYLAENAKHIIPPEECPFLNWYKWCCDKWGTKWPCFLNPTGEREEDAALNGNTIAFYTAWAPPVGIIKKLSEKYHTKIICAWQDDGNLFTNIDEYTPGAEPVPYFTEL